MTAESNAMLWNFYTRENFPHPVATSGPWEIRANKDRTHFAAIPFDRTKGHLPCGYGDAAYIGHAIRQGWIQPIAAEKLAKEHSAEISEGYAPATYNR